MLCVNFLYFKLEETLSPFVKNTLVLNTYILSNKTQYVIL